MARRYGIRVPEGPSSSRAASALPRVVAAVAAIAWLVVAARWIALPEEVLVTNLLVDDAFYFAKPALNLLAGRGFSFDGVAPSNGVQAAWAGVTIALAAGFDGTALLRAMLAVGAACWALAAWGLWRWLHPRSAAAAAFAASGLLWSGTHDRLAFQGMENALQALLTVLVLWAGTRALRGGWRPRDSWLLGAALALFALGRTEAAVLGGVVVAPLLFGRLGGAELSRGERLRTALRLAAPGVVAVGALYGFYRVEFDTWLPISGSVKTFYEDRSGRASVHGGTLQNIGWQLRFVEQLAIAPLRQGAANLLVEGLGLRVSHARSLLWGALGVLATLALLRWRGRAAAPATSAAGGGAFCWPLLAYALLHTAMMGALLPHFTVYGTWYFASEQVVTWLVLGAIAAAAAPARAVPMLLAALSLLLTAGGVVASRRLTQEVRTNHFRDAGLWLREHSEPGAHIGAMSSGQLGWYAEGRHVHNLDGLINTKAFLDDVLRGSRMPDYFAAQDITWISDYQPRSGWRRGLNWCGLVPAERLVPRHYARLGTTDAYVIWQVLPPGSHFELLGVDGPPVRDRFVELAVAADVHGRFPVVADGDLAARRAQQPDLVVARSLPQEPRLELCHVLATAAQLAAIALTPANVHPRVPADAEVLPGLRALGYDWVAVRDAGPLRLAVTVFWHVTAPLSGEAPTLCVLDRDGAAVARAPLGSCHGTRPASTWAPGSVVPETVVVTIGEGGEWQLAVEGAAASAAVRLPDPPRR